MRRFATGTSLLAIVLSLCVTAGTAGAAEVEVLADGQSWAWLNPGGTDPRAGDITFDATWTLTDPVGTPFNGPDPAPFEYGTVDAFNSLTTTDLGTPASLSRYTAYFRGTFNVSANTNPLSTFVEGVFDDGGVLYVDGVRVAGINYSSLTDTHFEFTDGEGNEAGNVRVALPALTAGPHTFALSLHQVNNTSSDLGFDFRIVHDPAVLARSIESGDDWNYLDDGSDQGTAWRASGFDDSGWANGPSQLGYGDSDEATVVDFGTDANNKFATTYFRKDFVVAAGELAGAQSLILGLVRDDAAAVFINGVPVRYDRLFYNAAFDDFSIPPEVGGADEDTFFQSVHDASLLVVGTNTIAVEIHQVNGTSSDISFDMFLQISSDPTPTTDPTVAPDGQPIAANFENNNDGLLTETSPVFDVSGLSMLGVTADLRTWQTSTTFENDDFAAILLEGSNDGGLNFFPLFQETLRGTELDAFDDFLDDAPGAFLPFTAMWDISGLVGEGFSQMRVVLMSDTDSASEHIEFGNFSVVPEPSSIALAMLGLVGLAGYGWRRRQA